MTTLVTGNRSTCIGSDYAIDLTAVVTLAGKFLLNGRDERIARLLSVAVLLVVFVAVVARIIIVRVRITVAVIVVWIIPPICPPWVKPDVEDDSRPVNKPAAVAVPPMLAISIPVAMPPGGMLREHMVVPICSQMISAAKLR